MSRKVIQVAVSESATELDGKIRHYRFTVALCDDGTMWQMTLDDDEWVKMPDVPPHGPTKEVP